MIRRAVRHLLLARFSVSREALFVKSGAADFAVVGLVTKLEVGLAKVKTFLDWVVWICFYGDGCFGRFGLYGLTHFNMLLRSAATLSLAGLCIRWAPREFAPYGIDCLVIITERLCESSCGKGFPLVGSSHLVD